MYDHRIAAKKKPRLLINHRSPAKSSGKATGISNYLIQLTSHLLDRMNCEVGLISSWDKNDFPEELTSRLSIFRRQRLIRPRVLDTMWQCVSMPKLVEEMKGDVVLNIDPVGTPTGGIARLFVVHDLYFKTIPQQYAWRERLFNDLIFRMMLAGNDAAICVSDNTLNDLHKFYPSSFGNAYRVYSGAPSICESTDRKTEEARKHLLWVGNITPNKNIGCFYKSLELLAEKGHQFETVVVGSDPQGLSTDARCHLRLAKPPIRLQNIPSEKLSELYRNAYCLVNCSLSEGFGLPVLEAQAKGTPVICPQGGAPAEVGGEDAVLTYPQNSAEDLSNQILALVNDKSLSEQLVHNGFENAKQFSWEKTAGQIEQLVMRVLKEKRIKHSRQITKGDASLENAL